MSLRINDVAPDFTADTTQGPINFHQWIGDGWAIMFSHPPGVAMGPKCANEPAHRAGAWKRRCLCHGRPIIFVCGP